MRRSNREYSGCHYLGEIRVASRREERRSSILTRRGADNLEFIRRINGLEKAADVKDIVFDASYLVMGLGDVYLGAPVATPMDPTHRLVTTKYNPARTWTAQTVLESAGLTCAFMEWKVLEGTN